MMSNEKDILSLLSESEKVVYQYIKEKSGENNNRLSQSMREIGGELGLSEATVHRAVRKLRKQGVIGIKPSTGKFETNEIIFYGIPDPEKQAEEIFQMINDLSLNAKRFEEVLKSKNNQIQQLLRDKEEMYKRIDELEQELKLVRSQAFEGKEILSSQPLDDQTIAYIVKVK